MVPDELPRDLPSFLARFGTDAQCRAYLFAQRWPQGFCCQGCGHGAAYHHRRRLIEECAACGKQHSLLAGTMFEQTKTGLARWFLAIWLVTSSKGGISAMELQRQMGFGSYQTAWSWLHKIRKAMVRPGAPAAGRTGRGRRDAGRRCQAGQARPWCRRQDRGRRCGRGGARQGPQASARPAAAQGRGRRLGREPGGLPRRQRGPARRGHHRRLAGLCRAGRGRLRPRARSTSATGWGDAVLRLPAIHLVFGLAKRWLLGTHHGAVSKKHLQAYLDEYVFRLYGASGVKL